MEVFLSRGSLRLNMSIIYIFEVRASPAGRPKSTMQTVRSSPLFTYLRLGHNLCRVPRQSGQLGRRDPSYYRSHMLFDLLWLYGPHN
jgi:hypothetical protein